MNVAVRKSQAQSERNGFELHSGHLADAATGCSGRIVATMAFLRSNPELLCGYLESQVISQDLRRHQADAMNKLCDERLRETYKLIGELFIPKA